MLFKSKYYSGYHYIFGAFGSFVQVTLVSQFCFVNLQVEENRRG